MQECWMIAGLRWIPFFFFSFFSYFLHLLHIFATGSSRSLHFQLFSAGAEVTAHTV